MRNEKDEEDLEGVLTFQLIRTFYLCWSKMAPKSQLSTFRFIHLRQREGSTEVEAGIPNISQLDTATYRAFWA